MIRKIKSKFSPMKPDTLHLHQLIFFYYSKNIKLKKNILNTLTGISINIYNVIIIYFSSINIYNTKIQILLLILSIIVYLFSYFYFKAFRISFFKK